MWLVIYSGLPLTKDPVPHTMLPYTSTYNAHSCAYAQILFVARSTFTQNHAGLLTSKVCEIFASFFDLIFCKAITSTKINTAESENNVHEVNLNNDIKFNVIHNEFERVVCGLSCIDSFLC